VVKTSPKHEKLEAKSVGTRLEEALGMFVLAGKKDLPRFYQQEKEDLRSS
jgi:hypothetical protein